MLHMYIRISYLNSTPWLYIFMPSGEIICRSKLNKTVAETTALTQRIEDRHATILSNRHEMQITGV